MQEDETLINWAVASVTHLYLAIFLGIVMVLYSCGCDFFGKFGYFVQFQSLISVYGKWKYNPWFN